MGQNYSCRCKCPESKVHGSDMGPTWVLSITDGPHVGPMNLAIRVVIRPSATVMFSSWLLSRTSWYYRSCLPNHCHYIGYDLGRSGSQEPIYCIVRDGFEKIPLNFLMLVFHLITGFLLLTVTPTWISYHMPGKVGDGITYSFPNFNGFMMDVIPYPCWGKS